VVSIHRRPDGKPRPSCAGCSHGYSGPQAVYPVGTRHLVGWQALDYARQRYVPGGDYTRQRHQRQLIKAMVAKALRGDLLKDPIKFTQVVHALGSTLVFDGRGRKPVEFAFALRKLRAESITSVGLPGGSVYSGGQYLGESLGGVQSSYFAALRQDRIDAWVKSHSNLVNPDPR
jgi:anionic cell wall polymer biosynthesis LytR-Cps2A-Psr (LCP) family protein